MIRRYAFVTLPPPTCRARGVPGRSARLRRILEKDPGQFFIVNAGGLRLCVNLADDDVHIAGGRDPVIGLKVDSVPETLAALAARGVAAPTGPVSAQKGSYAVVRDPDGRAVILRDAD